MALAPVADPAYSRKVDGHATGRDPGATISGARNGRVPSVLAFAGALVASAYTYYYLAAAPQLLAHAAGMLDAALEARP